MELYIPPPQTYLPRLPPPRPAAPPVPLVAIPDLPEIIHAPEGAYTLNKDLFPSIGTPVAPLPYDVYRPPMPTVAQSMLGGAGGFIVPPPGGNVAPPGQTAMSFGTSVVNGQVQPAHPVKMSWVNIWFPPKTVGGGGLGSKLGMGGGGGAPVGNQAAPPPSSMPGYEASVSSGSDDQPSDIPPIMEVPLTALPQGGTSSKRNPFARATPAVAPNALAMLPRPKTGLRQSNSTFVTRLQAADNLPKIIAERGKGGGEWVRWGFWNLGRTFGWAEEGGKMKEPFARVTFSVVPTCHAVSPITASPDRLDIIVGFVTGDIVWLDFIAGKYTRINKSGLLNNSSVISINFHPRQPQNFTAAFADNTIMQFNLFAEDPATIVSNSPFPWITKFESSSAPNTDTLATVPEDSEAEGSSESLMVWKNEDWAQLTTVRAVKKMEESERSPWAGKNPIAAYKVGKKPITAMSYSPDGRLLAAVFADGMLRLMDMAEERLEDTFAGYYASLNCVSWSPDSRFVAVGGEDDLVSIYSPKEQRLVARCQGHSAFVTCIAFDPTRGGGGGGYRFGSVGEDAKLLLWDFTSASLHRPRHHGHLPHPSGSQHRLPQGLGSTVSLTNQNEASIAAQAKGERYHVAPPRSEVALLQPVLARVVEGNLLTSIHMSPNAIVTISRSAQVKFWQRPPKASAKDLRKRVPMNSGSRRDEMAMTSPKLSVGRSGLVGA